MILSQCCDCREPSGEVVESLLNSQGSNGVEAGEGGTALGTPPRRGDPLGAQMRHLTGELSKTNTELAKTVASVGDSMEASKAVSAVKEVVETNNRILGEIKENLRNISDDMREMRRDLRVREDRIYDALKKISENTEKSAAAAAPSPAQAPAPASRASEMSAEERLLLESFGLSSGSLASLLHFQQQQMIQQQLARQTPNMMARMANMTSMAYPGMSMNNMYGTAGMFSPVVTGVSGGPAQRPPVPALPQQPLAPAQRAPASAPSNVVISVSDPIPHTLPVIMAPMTVTVPPHHRLGGLSNSRSCRSLELVEGSVSDPPLLRQGLAQPPSR